MILILLLIALIILTYLGALFFIKKIQTYPITPIDSYVKQSSKGELFYFSQMEAEEKRAPFIAMIANVTCITDRCFPLTEDKSFLYTYQGTLDFFQKDLSRKFFKISGNLLSWMHPGRKIRGTTADLAWTHVRNYYHWMTELIPKLALLKLSNKAFDKVLISVRDSSQPLAHFEIETLKLYGIREDQIILCSRPCKFKLEKALMIPPSCDLEGVPSFWFVQDLKSKLLGYYTPTQKPKRKIYISRNDSTRKILNEDLLVKQLSKYGFERVFLSGLSVQEQAKLFDEASHIIAPHGAGLTNLIFCNKSTYILEILPDYRIIHQFGQADAFADIAKKFGFSLERVEGRCIDVNKGVFSDQKAPIKEIMDKLSKNFGE